MKVPEINIKNVNRLINRQITKENIFQQLYLEAAWLDAKNKNIISCWVVYKTKYEKRSTGIELDYIHLKNSPNKVVFVTNSIHTSIKNRLISKAKHKLINNLKGEKDTKSMYEDLVKLSHNLDIAACPRGSGRNIIYTGTPFDNKDIYKRIYGAYISQTIMDDIV